MTVTFRGTTEEVSQILHHHAVLRRGLEERVGAVCAAAEAGAPFEAPVAALQEFLAGEILPHAEAEEHTLYSAAASQARGGQLVAAMTAEHRTLAGLAAQLQAGAGAAAAASTAESIATLFASHVAKENDLLLPALVDSGVDLAPLLARMHAAA
ncbi:MAG: hemerythrin domain-containing protein [Micromonosporaceae bacterium]